MVTGIVVTHGKLAEELLETARMIFGEFSDCFSVSNAAKSPQMLIDELSALISKGGGGPYLIFVDFFGGSCSYACYKLLESFQNVRAVSGINLPMLLAFLNKREEMTFEHLLKEIIMKGKDGIQILERKNL